MKRFNPRIMRDCWGTPNLWDNKLHAETGAAETQKTLGEMPHRTMKSRRCNANCQFPALRDAEMWNLIQSTIQIQIVLLYCIAKVPSKNIAESLSCHDFLHQICRLIFNWKVTHQDWRYTSAVDVYKQTIVVIAKYSKHLYVVHVCMCACAIMV